MCWCIFCYHDGYPPLQVLLPEEYIPPSLHNFCNFKPTMFHHVNDYLCPTKILLPPEDDVERLLANVTINMVEDIEKTDGERLQNLSYNLGTCNGKWRKSSPIVNMWTIRKLQPMRKMRPMVTYTSSEH